MYNILVIHRQGTNQSGNCLLGSNRNFSGLYGRARRNTSSVLHTNVGVHDNPLYIKPDINSKHSPMC